MGDRKRKCMKCGKICSGKMCQKCYRNKKRGQLSRISSLKK